MKKFLSLIIALSILVAPLTFVTASAAVSTASVTVDGTVYKPAVGESFTYTFYMSYPAKVAAAQFELPVDFTLLSGPSAAELNAAITATVPVAASTAYVSRFDKPNKNGFTGYVVNFASESGYDFTSFSVAFTIRFKALKAGAVTLSAKVREVIDGNGADIVDVKGVVRKSGFSTVDKYALTALGTPALSSASSAAAGVTFKWAAVSDAMQYRVFRKTGSGGWTKLADTTAVSYTDKTVKSGTKYTYTARCISADGKSYTSSYNTKGLTVTYVAMPKLSSVANAVGGVTVKWAKVTGAAKYRIFRKTGTGGWTKLADTTAVSYTDKTVKSGTKYSYTVRCISADAKSYTSAYDTAGKTVTYIAAPAVPTLKNTKNGIQITWKKPAGAVKYRIFRKVGNGKWTKLADTTALTYTDKTAKNKTKYSYTIRCISKDGKTFTSAYNTTGKAITCKR